MGHALRAALGGIASEIGDLLAVGLVPLLPVLLALAVLRLGPGLWPPLDPLRPALAVAGLVAALLLARRHVAGDRWPAALTLAAATLLLTAAALAAWPLARHAALVWQASALAHAQGHGLAGALASAGQRLAWDTPAPGPAWLTWGVSAAVLLLLALFQQALVIRPVRTLLGLSREAADGPWTSAFLAPVQRHLLARHRTGLPLGLEGGRLLRYAPDPERSWLAGHHAVFAGTRAGKGVSCVLPAILDHDGPVVVLDIKGENFAVTRRYRQSLGRRVAVLNPFGVIEPSRDRFNPLDYLRPEHLGRDAALLADGLIRPEPGAESHFTDIARTLLTAALEVAAATAAPAQRTLPAVADRLLGPLALEELKAWAAQPGLYGGGRAAQAAAAVLRAGDREQGSFFTTLARNLDWLASEPMREFLSASDVDLEALLDDRLDLYIVVPLDLVAQQANFLRLLTNLVLGTVIRQDGRRQLAQRLLLVLDEFTRLGPDDAIDEHRHRCRRVRDRGAVRGAGQGQPRCGVGAGRGRHAAGLGTWSESPGMPTDLER